MKARFEECAATMNGVKVGIRVESGAAVKFLTVDVPWQHLMVGDFARYLDKAYRQALNDAWDDSVVALF